MVPQKLKEKQRYLPLLCFSRRDEEIYSSGRGGEGPNGSHLAQPIGTRKGKLDRGKHESRLGCVVQFRKGGK